MSFLKRLHGRLDPAYRKRRPLTRNRLELESLEQRLALDADPFEVDDTPAQAKPIATDGTAQTRSFHVGFDIDWATFALSAPAEVTFRTDGQPGGDTELRLYGPDDPARFIAYDDDSGPDLYSLISRHLQPGTYYLRLNEYGIDNVLDKYALSVTALFSYGDPFEVDDTAVQAKAIATDGTAQTHSFHAGTDVDWVTFVVAAGPAHVTIQTDGVRGGDTEVRLFGPDDPTRLIASDDDSGPDLYSQVDRSGSQALPVGRYYVRVNEYGGNDPLSSYSLRVFVTPARGDVFEVDDTPDQAKAIATDGTAQVHNFHAGTDVDWATFFLTGLANVTIQTTGVRGGDAELRLFGPDDPARLIAYDDDSAGGLYPRMVRRDAQALAPGRYYIRLNEHGSNNSLSNYTLSVLASPPGDSRAPLVLQAEDGQGDGELRDRSNASGSGNTPRTRWLRPGEEVVMVFVVPQAGSYRLEMRYSRDSLGLSPTVAFSIDNQPTGELLARSTNRPGELPGVAWNNFRTDGLANAVYLTASRHELRLRVNGGDMWGLEIDTISLFLV